MLLTKAQLNAIAATDVAISELAACLLNARQLGVTIVVTGGEDVSPWIKSRSIKQRIDADDIVESLRHLAVTERSAELEIDGVAYTAESPIYDTLVAEVPKTPCTPDESSSVGIVNAVPGEDPALNYIERKRRR